MPAIDQHADVVATAVPAYRWPDRFAKLISDNVHQQVHATLSGSRLTRKSCDIQLIRPSDIFHVGRVLGTGAFSQVSPVITKDGRKYACKHLKQDLMERPEDFQLAATELACEAHILSSFDHPNILKVRGWAENGIASFEEGQHNSFFLLLDLLDETLDQRIDRWRDEQEHRNLESAMMVPQNLSLSPSCDELTQLWEHMRYPVLTMDNTIKEEHQLVENMRVQNLYLQKIRIMSELASALDYIHSMGVIFRDLKPNNVGFSGDKVQIFDFGLSRELPSLDTSIPFAMSGMIGTLRYMAPEVANHQAYNVSSDVYSWAIVAYELLSLEKPFNGWTRDLHADLVCNRGVRPDTTNTLHPIPPEMKALLERSWSAVASNRGTMSQIHMQLQFLEAQQLAFVTRQQIEMEFHQRRKQEQLIQCEAQRCSINTSASNSFHIDMSYCVAPPPLCKLRRISSFDSIGTIETSSLSSDSERF